MGIQVLEPAPPQVLLTGQEHGVLDDTAAVPGLLLRLKLQVPESPAEQQMVISISSTGWEMSPDQNESQMRWI
ncbi:MAG TPA: hypothetical protein VIT41_16935 [Microlunatus sp.]